MYAQYGIESLGLKKKTEKKHKKKLLPKTEIWCLVKRCIFVVYAFLLVERYSGPE